LAVQLFINEGFKISILTTSCLDFRTNEKILFIEPSNFALQGGNAVRVVGFGGRECCQSVDHKEWLEAQRDWLHPHLKPGREHQDEKNHGKNRPGIRCRNHCLFFLKSF